MMPRSLGIEELTWNAQPDRQRLEDGERLLTRISSARGCLAPVEGLASATRSLVASCELSWSIP